MKAELLNLLGENGEHWTQYVLARLADGQEASSHNPSAVKWCLLGACRKLELDTFEVGQALSGITGEKTIAEFNDDNDWPTVKAAIEKLP